MNGTNLFKIALRALANNKLRAFLTMLGIIIGVASVITMLAIGQGSKKSIQQQISEMGSNMIMIHPGADLPTTKPCVMRQVSCPPSVPMFHHRGNSLPETTTTRLP